MDLVERVADDLEQMILNGRLLPGDRLPPERELGTTMGVSRSVVREAIKRLQSLGLVSSLQGSGTRVERPSSKPLIVGYGRLMRYGEATLEQLSVVRLPLETTIVALAAKSRTEAHLNQLKDAQRQLKDESPTFEAQAKADLLFHATLAEATGNPVFQIVLAPIQEMLIESRRKTLTAYGVELAYQHHQRILDAIEKQDVEGAVEAMTEHLQANVEHLRTLRATDGDSKTGDGTDGNGKHDGAAVAS